MNAGSCISGGSRGADAGAVDSRRFVGERVGARAAAVGGDHGLQVRRAGFQPGDQIAALGGGHDGAAVRVFEPIGDLRLARIVADRHADRAGARDGEARLDPLRRVRQQDRDRVAGRDAVIRQMRGEPRGALLELRVGDRRLRVAIRDLGAALARVTLQQFRDRRDQIGVQHCQTME